MIRRAAPLALLLLAAPAMARELTPDQTVYATTQEGSGEAVHAEWIEPDGTQRQLDFHLPAQSLLPQSRRITPPSPAEVQRLGMQAAQAEAERAPAGVHIQLRPIANGVDARANGPAGADLSGPMRRVMAAYHNAANTAVRDAGFRFRTPTLAEPDFPRLVREHGALLRGAAAEIARQTDRLPPRARVQFLISFLQSLPYETLVHRGESAMRTPSGVLADDRGDCDAKSITLAALLSLVLPELNTALIYDDVHAFLGASLPPEPGDAAFSVDGRSYVALEPVGPGWFPVGQISPMSQAILRSGTAHIAPLH